MELKNLQWGIIFSNVSYLGFKIVLQNELPGLLIDWDDRKHLSFMEQR